MLDISKPDYDLKVNYIRNHIRKREKSLKKFLNLIENHRREVIARMEASFPDFNLEQKYDSKASEDEDDIIFNLSASPIRTQSDTFPKTSTPTKSVSQRNDFPTFQTIDKMLYPLTINKPIKTANTSIPQITDCAQKRTSVSDLIDLTKSSSGMDELNDLLMRINNKALSLGLNDDEITDIINNKLNLSQKNNKIAQKQKKDLIIQLMEDKMKSNEEFLKVKEESDRLETIIKDLNQNPEILITKPHDRNKAQDAEIERLQKSKTDLLSQISRFSESKIKTDELIAKFTQELQEKSIETKDRNEKFLKMSDEMNKLKSETQKIIARTKTTLKTTDNPSKTTNISIAKNSDSPAMLTDSSRVSDEISPPLFGSIHNSQMNDGVKIDSNKYINGSNNSYSTKNRDLKNDNNNDNNNNNGQSSQTHDPSNIERALYTFAESIKNSMSTMAKNSQSSNISYSAKQKPMICKLTVPNFDGNFSKAIDWLVNFKSIADNNGWDDEHKVRSAKAHLTGNAINWFNLEFPEMNVFNDEESEQNLVPTFKEFCNRFKEYYRPEGSEFILERELANLRKSKYESYTDFLNRFLTTARYANQNMDESRKMHYLKEAFDKDSNLTYILHYKSIKEITNCFRDIDAIKSRYRVTQNKTYESSVLKSQAWDKDILNNKDSKQLEADLKYYRNKCFNCGIRGHQEKDCQTEQNELIISENKQIFEELKNKCLKFKT